MPTIGDRVTSTKIKALVFGPSKSGKTFGAGSWPRPNFFDFDQGVTTLQGLDFVKRYSWDLAKTIQYEEFKETDTDTRGIIKVPNAFDNACKYFDEWMKKSGRWKGQDVGVDMFDTWVIDTGTTLSEVAMNKGIYLLGGKEFKGAQSETHDMAKKHGLLVPKIQDYGAERSMVEQFVDMVLQSDKNVLLLCHTIDKINDSGALIATVPLLTGKGIEAVCAMFDEVWFLKTRREGDGMRRELMTQTNGLVKCGTRLGVPNGTEFDYTAVYKAVTDVQKQTTTLKGS